MTKEELKERNPWAKFLDKIKDNLELYAEGGKQCYEEDLNSLEEFNNLLDKKSDESKKGKYQLELPPCPWDGNPLEANVIFLTLNPGYVEKFNKGFSRLVSCNDDLNARILDFRKKTLRLEADLRPEYDCKQEPMTTFDAVEIMDDMYWTNKFKSLYKALEIDQNEEGKMDFRKKVSILQYIAYTSEKFKGPEKETFKSQGFTKELIKFRLENATSENLPLFVIMRSRDRWIKLLGELITDYPSHFIFRKQVTIKGNLQDPRGQFITENSFSKDDDWARIINALK